MPCDGVAPVLEVTSAKPKADRETKRRCYARGGIPLCLLVDRETSSITLFGALERDDHRDDHRDDYREVCTRPPGKTLSLPAPSHSTWTPPTSSDPLWPGVVRRTAAVVLAAAPKPCPCLAPRQR
ncbi:hypothetical protein APS67_005172 [Streptomyces sp. AVP053U2]|nr:hypothetical protein APS67_005172 [Streptomyces sp. AVP053U2]